MRTPVTQWLSQQWFSFIHQNNLVYTTCWEDPRLDRQALQLDSKSRVLMITSAGCNALDYVLAGAGKVFAVDVNPRQNALLELKLAAIRALNFETFYRLFGDGKHEDFPAVYRQALRPLLSTEAQKTWDKQLDYFRERGTRAGFYFRGSVGVFAKWLHHYIDFARIREALNAAFATKSLAEQAYIYQTYLRQTFWNPVVRSVLSWDAPFALLGVPRVQKKEVAKGGSVGQFLEHCLDTVFGKLPLQDNYFWWLYFNGAYSPDRCPEYLKEENFSLLKNGLADRIEVKTCSLVDFMREKPEAINRFVLLDHMDWLRGSLRPVLEEEWRRMLDIAAPDAKFIWRSAASDGHFVDDIPVLRHGRRYRVGDALAYDDALASELHALDRVHTYRSFSIANLNAGWAC